MKTLKNALMGTGLLFLIFTSCQKKALEPAAPRLPSKAEFRNVLLPQLGVGAPVQEFSEKIYVIDERERMQALMPWSDFEPTGYYVMANTPMVINLEQVAGTRLPQLLIGTYSREKRGNGWEPAFVQLQAGLNQITPNRSGLLWIRYGTSQTPQGKVKISFTSGAMRAPVFIKGQTTDWEAQLQAYAACPEVVLINDNNYLVHGRDRALSLSTQDLEFILNTVDQSAAAENRISGFDGSSPVNNYPAFKILMVESKEEDDLWGEAAFYRVFFHSGLWNGALTVNNIIKTGWGAWHELGHMHQQMAWTWDKVGEVTVNIYTLAAERAIGGGGVNRLKGPATQNALNFIANTSITKDFNNDNAMPDPLLTRLFMFHQLWLAFGDPFFMALHKQTRAEKPNQYATRAVKMRYFMVKACKISGRNLTTFFKKWGFRVSASVYSEIARLNLPQPDVEPSTLTD